MDSVLIICLAVLFLYIIVMIPLQYRNISEMKANKQMARQTHNEMYDKMSFEEQEMQYNLQGNLLTLPATLIASLLYKIRHWNEK